MLIVTDDIPSTLQKKAVVRRFRAKNYSVNLASLQRIKIFTPSPEALFLFTAMLSRASTLESPTQENQIIPQKKQTSSVALTTNFPSTTSTTTTPLLHVFTQSPITLACNLPQAFPLHSASLNSFRSFHRPSPIPLIRSVCSLRFLIPFFSLSCLQARVYKRSLDCCCWVYSIA